MIKDWFWPRKKLNFIFLLKMSVKFFNIVFIAFMSVWFCQILWQSYNIKLYESYINGVKDMRRLTEDIKNNYLLVKSGHITKKEINELPKSYIKSILQAVYITICEEDEKKICDENILFDDYSEPLPYGLYVWRNEARAGP